LVPETSAPTTWRGPRAGNNTKTQKKPKKKKKKNNQKKNQKKKKKTPTKKKKKSQFWGAFGISNNSDLEAFLADRIVASPRRPWVTISSTGKGNSRRQYRMARRGVLISP